MKIERRFTNLVLLAGTLVIAACGDVQTESAGPGPTEVWEAEPGTTWQWQLDGSLDRTVDVDMYDIDLFDTAASTISALHDDGRIVICYFSAGTREGWRLDADEFAEGDIGNTLEDYPDEAWLDIRSAAVRAVMSARLDLAVSKGCDGVEPDNVMAYEEDSGFPISESDQIAYNRFLAEEAHARNLSIGLKNAVGLVPSLEPDFDWALNEECLAYEECGPLVAFIDAEKAVFHVEYVDDPSEGPARLAEVCGDPAIEGFSTLIKTWDLDAWRLACD